MRVSLLLLITTTLFAQEKAEDEVRYVIRIHDAVVGYARTRTTSDPQGVQTIQGETLFKLVQNGHETARESHRTTVWKPDERLPRECHVRNTQDGIVSEYNCRVDGEKVSLDATINGVPAKAQIPAASVLGVLTYNAPEHFHIFILDRLKTPGGFKGSVLVLEMMSALPIDGEASLNITGQFGNHVLVSDSIWFRALGMLYKPHMDENCKLTSIEVPSQNFVAERTEKPLEDLHLVAADLARSFSVPMRFAERVTEPGEAAHAPRAVREAKLRVHVKVGENKTDAEVLDNTRETFEPAADAKEGWIDGTITIRARDPKPEADLSPFLAKEDGIESDAPEVMATAKELIPDGTPPLDAARRACAWVNKTVEYDTRLVSALAAHQGKLGDCLSMARLTIALLRTRGVPARTIGGIALGGSGRLGQHHWVEVYLGAEKGWLQVDPTYGQCDAVDAFHLDLWRQGTLDGSADNWVELQSWEPAK